MGESGRKTLMSLAGVYLVYVGGKLFLDAMREKPGNYIFMMIMGIIFVVCGIGTIVIYMRGVFKHEKIEEADEDDEAADPSEDIEAGVSAGEDEQAGRRPMASVNFADLKLDDPGTSEHIQPETSKEGEKEAAPFDADDGVYENEDNAADTEDVTGAEDAKSKEEGEETEKISK